MYAFCPVPDLKEDICGFGHSIYDFNFYADTVTQSIKTNKMKHYEKIGLDQLERQHYICHYLIQASQDTQLDIDSYLIINFKNLNGLIVRIYEGKSRESALNPIVEFNQQPVVGKEYRVKWNSGLLVVAIPNENEETQFEFDYRIQPSANSNQNKMVIGTKSELMLSTETTKIEDTDEKLVSDTTIINVAVLISVFYLVFCIFICYQKHSQYINRQK